MSIMLVIAELMMGIGGARPEARSVILDALGGDGRPEAGQDHEDEPRDG